MIEKLSYTEKKRVRRNFGKIRSVLAIPNLIQTQKTSFEKFLQTDTPSAERLPHGIQNVLTTIFPIAEEAGRMTLEFIKYEIEEPQNDEAECRTQSLTYEGTIRTTLRLTIYDTDEITGIRSVRDIREQEVYLGNVPLMTEKGTFIINGTDRTVVSQVHRSPGVFFEFDKNRSVDDKKAFTARLIPYRGAWLDFEFDSNNILHVRVDRRRKQPVSTLLMALPWKEDGSGLSKEEVLEKFYSSFIAKRTEEGWIIPFEPEHYPTRGALMHALRDAQTGEVLLKAGERLSPLKLKNIKTKELLLTDEEIVGLHTARPIYTTEEIKKTTKKSNKNDNKSQSCRPKRRKSVT